MQKNIIYDYAFKIYSKKLIDNKKKLIIIILKKSTINYHWELNLRFIEST